MGKVKENMGAECPPKVKAIYQAVFELFEEGADLNSFTVSEITKKAGIGKGTAYEYFSDKEEMIAKAIFYNVGVFCQKICEGISREKNLYDKVNFMLFTIEQQMPRANCLFRLVNIISQNSVTNRRFREVIERQKLSEERPVIKIARQILGDSLKDKKELSEEKETYLIMSVSSKILGYCDILMGERQYGKAERRDIMRGLICRGICKEVEEIESL